MEKTTFEVFFSNIDKSVAMIQNELEMTYLEALIYVGEMLFQANVDVRLSEVTTQQLKKYISSVHLEELKTNEIQKAFYLAVLKGMKEGTQANHEMTPDAVAVFISFLVNKLTEKKEHFRLLDLAIGSGNLMFSILNNTNKEVSAFGIEPDETLLKLAYVGANLQQKKLELFHQDSLTKVFIDPVDVVVADLPVGYYPNEEIASSYHLKASEGMSYTHHLMIEQALNYTQKGGFLIFLIPNFMFESNEAKRLHHYLKEHAYIYSLMQLPKTMFKNEKLAKSIFIVRKKQENLKVPSQALLAELPSFSNQQSLSEMIKSISNWLDAYISQ